MLSLSSISCTGTAPVSDRSNTAAVSTCFHTANANVEGKMTLTLTFWPQVQCTPRSCHGLRSTKLCWEQNFCFVEWTMWIDLKCVNTLKTCSNRFYMETEKTPVRLHFLVLPPERDLSVSARLIGLHRPTVYPVPHTRTRRCCSVINFCFEKLPVGPNSMSYHAYLLICLPACFIFYIFICTLLGLAAALYQGWQK